MAGSSSTSAPNSRSGPDRADIRSRGRVTATRSPASGRFSAQANRSDSAQTFPTITTEGAENPWATWGSWARVETARRWRAVVPRSRMAAGISGSMPASKSPRQISGRVDTPIKKTSVPPSRTNAR